MSYDFAGRRFAGFGFYAALCLAVMPLLAADEKPEVAPTEDVQKADLAVTQETIEMKYRRFEGTLQQLSEYLRKTDPARAELLVRAIGKSKEGRIADQLQTLTELLKKDQLGDAVDRQQAVIAEFQALLELLMSEARKDEIELKKRWVQDLIKDVNKLIGKETDARAETERGGNPSNLQGRQKQVSDATDQLLKKIEAHDALKKSGKNQPESDSDEKPNDSQSPKNDSENQAPGNPDEKKDSDSKKNDGKPSKAQKGSKNSSGDAKSKKDGDTPKPDQESKDLDGEKKPSKDSQDSKEPSPSKESPKDDEKSESGEKSEKGKDQSSQSPKGQSKKGKPKKGQSQEGQQPDQQSPEKENQSEQDQQSGDEQEPQPKPGDKTAGREEIQRAKREMDRAIEELKKNSKKGASEKQDRAIAELMKAKEKLEEILRITRQEEREMVLAQLEARFRDMLLKQEAVYNATLSIHAVPVDDRTERHSNRAIELARNEAEISLLAEKALTLLKEEGSSVAFPEAVEQIRDDMITVTRRLERADVGEITQNVEQDTIEGLKEIIEAMQKELEKLKDKKQQPPSAEKQQQQQKEGLVKKLAEMKMLRSLQYRVNRRTRQLGRLVDGEQAVDADVINQLKQLSDRQAKVQKATNDLATGKNQ